MDNPVIWLHEDALRITHPVFAVAPAHARVVHVWDDAALQAAEYTLKRLVFLYETLCQLPLEILHGDTVTVLRGLGTSLLYVPSTTNACIQNTIATLSGDTTIHVIPDEPFADIKKPKDVRRFFQYWKQAEASAFLCDAGMNNPREE